MPPHAGRLCACVCLCARASKDVHANGHSHNHVCARVYTFVHLRTCTKVCTRAHKHADKNILECAHIQKHAHTLAGAQVYLAGLPGQSQVRPSLQTITPTSLHAEEPGQTQEIWNEGQFSCVHGCVSRFETRRANKFCSRLCVTRSSLQTSPETLSNDNSTTADIQLHESLYCRSTHIVSKHEFVRNTGSTHRDG
jgi:hypothetical protein